MLNFLIFAETAAFALSLLLLIPAGMLFDGGYTLKAWAGFLLILSLPLSLLASVLFALHFRKRNQIATALRVTAVPLVPIAIMILAALAGF